MSRPTVQRTSGLNMDKHRKRQRRECQRQIEIARDRQAWSMWLAALRARVWVRWGRLCAHGGSKASERVADETHSAGWFAQQRKICEATVRMLRPPLPVDAPRRCRHPMHDDDCPHRCASPSVT